MHIFISVVLEARKRNRSKTYIQNQVKNEALHFQKKHINVKSY